MRLGNGRFESTQFNSRLQPTQIALGTSAFNTSLLKLNYDYGTTDNNGNVKQQTITVPNMANPLIQTYTYDSLNRLQSATETSNSIQTWKQTFNFDRYGNRRFDTSNNNTTTLPSGYDPNVFNPTFNSSNNRMNDNQGYEYDQSGNVTKDATNKRFVYDAENKQTSFGTNGSSTNGGNYFYDGDGRRVKKVVGTETTIFVYNASGQLVAEYSTTAPTNPQTSYLTTDTLGSPRINTDAFGSVKARHDYLPFGEEIANGVGGRTTQQGYGGQDNIRQKFTLKERDGETGLDYFNARYYSSAYGRFASPDEFVGVPREIQTLGSGHPRKQALPYSEISNPQSLNKYQYTYNNPLKYIDPDGHGIETAIDVLSLAESFYNLISDPSWKNVGFLIWDAGATLIPFVPGSWVAKVGKYGYRGLEASGIVKKLDDFETIVNNRYIQNGIALLGQGDKGVRKTLGIPDAEAAADFLGVTKGGTFRIAETKGSDIRHGVEQLTNTAKYLLQKVPGAKFTAELVLRKGQKLPGNYKVNGNHLMRWEPSTPNFDTDPMRYGAWELVKINGQQVTVRFVDVNK
jgi:RHS repeat-associated protein